MTSIPDVMRALKATLKNIDGLAVSMAQTGQVNPPMAVLGVPTILDYRKAFGGLRLDIEPSITILTSSAFDEIGTLMLADFFSPSGPRSIVACIDADPTLGGVVERARVTDARPLGLEEFGAIGYYGGILTVSVMARGNP